MFLCLDCDFIRSISYYFVVALQTAAHVLSHVHLDHVDRNTKLASELMEDLVAEHAVPLEKHVLLFTHIRLAQAFSTHALRVQCVQARLQAISILVYSNAIQENVNMLLYNGLIEELVDILEVKDSKLLVSGGLSMSTAVQLICEVTGWI